nr:immunoglobulin heavy chain junction region [Macaca mulatta]MOX39783.1 immunoglobulin heavy chain junction region [Macaca mulatta]MOX40210.1 immunoglobulin heavy chain junction region [Macaca mulatta]MOX40625.1 immunoglobulin heavy chain junction region [Macaca mulatta]
CARIRAGSNYVGVDYW